VERDVSNSIQSVNVIHGYGEILESTIPFSRMYSYVRSRQLEGTYSNDQAIGSWILTAMRVDRGWGIPTDEDWPYDGSAANWPPKEPQGIDRVAKARRLLAYQRVRTLDDCKMALAAETPVSVALRIDADDWESATSGDIPMPSKFKKVREAHSVLLVGYNDEDRRLIVRNSWGPAWGDKGYGYIQYDYFKRFQLEAWVASARYALRPSSGTATGIIELTWGMPDRFASTPLHGLEIFDAAADECIGWAFVVERSGFADIEGHVRQCGVIFRCS